MTQRQLTAAQAGAAACFCLAAERFRIYVNQRELLRSGAIDTTQAPELIIAGLAHSLGLKATSGSTQPRKLARAQLPVIVRTHDERYALLIDRDDQGYLALFPSNRAAPVRIAHEQLESTLSERCLVLRETRETPDEHRSFGLGWFRRPLASTRDLILRVLLASLVMQIFATAMPLFSQVIIDKVLVHNNLSALYVLGIGMAVLTLFELVLTVLRTQQQSHIAARIELELGLQVKRRLLSLPMSYFSSRSSGHVMGLFRELDTVRQFITGPSATSLVDITFLVVFIPLMCFYSPLLTAITLGTAVLMGVASLLMTPGTRERMQQHSDAASESSSRLIENVAGAHTIKALGAERVMRRKWEEAFAKQVVSTVTSTNAQGNATAVSIFIQRASTLAILWIGAHLAMRGELSVGQLIAFQMLSARVLHPAMRLSQLWQDLRQVEHSMRRVADIMEAPSEHGGRGGVKISEPETGDIQLRGVSFRYSMQVPILSDVSLTLPQGKTIALVGRSGSGKSTLLKLLVRLYEPDMGSIRYGQVNLRDIDHQALRGRIALVPQDSQLFSGTIAENIALHAPWMPRERIIAAARCACADEFVEALEDGYDTEVGARGMNLSGGQRQRIAIARAILREPDVLVLDEATSALDYLSERSVLGNLSRHFSGRTLVIVTHRIQSVHNADLIYALADGRVAESGTHAELMLRHGLYRQLNAGAETPVNRVA